MDLEKIKIYDELCSVLTMYEDNKADDKDLYAMLVKIQNSWEDIITREEEKNNMDIDDSENVRVCSECGKKMRAGYCIHDGELYYCSDECLHKDFTDEDFLEMYDNGKGDSYYTSWED